MNEWNEWSQALAHARALCKVPSPSRIGAIALALMDARAQEAAQPLPHKDLVELGHEGARQKRAAELRAMPKGG